MEENRIESGIKEWREHMRRLSAMFDESITKHPNIRKTQLAHFREVLQRPLPNITKDEKMMLPILKAEIGRMEKELYPSRLVRIVRSIGRMFDRMEKKVAEPVQPMFKESTTPHPMPSIQRNTPAWHGLEQRTKRNHDLMPKKRNGHPHKIKR